MVSMKSTISILQCASSLNADFRRTAAIKTPEVIASAKECLLQRNGLTLQALVLL